MIQGIDVSVLQGQVDFEAEFKRGTQFCIARCGVGNNGKDSMYQHNIQGAQAAGMQVGAYHFLFPLPTESTPSRDPRKQAAQHFQWAGPLSVVAADLEYPVQADWAHWNCSAQQIQDWTLAYLEEYQTLSGIRPLIYTYPNYAQCLKLTEDFAAYRLWIASYEPTPSIPYPWNDYVMWQTSGGTAEKLLNGMAVDTNVAKDLSLWGVVSQTVPVFENECTGVNITNFK